MIKYCPIISFQQACGGGVLCLGKNCAFSDEDGECLIKQGLQWYISAARTQVVDKIEELRGKVVTSSSGHPYIIEPTSDCTCQCNFRPPTEIK